MFLSYISDTLVVYFLEIKKFVFREYLKVENLVNIGKCLFSQMI